MDRRTFKLRFKRCMSDAGFEPTSSGCRLAAEESVWEVELGHDQFRAGQIYVVIRIVVPSLLPEPAGLPTATMHCHLEIHFERVPGPVPPRAAISRWKDRFSYLGCVLDLTCPEVDDDERQEAIVFIAREIAELAENGGTVQGLAALYRADVFRSGFVHKDLVSRIDATSR